MKQNRFDTLTGTETILAYEPIQFKYNINKGGVFLIEILLSVLSGLYFLALNVRESYVFPKQLSKKEEEMYIQKKEQGDEDARQKLIAHNLRLVSHISKKYYSKTGEPEELISIGTIGLIKGVDSYKSDKKTKLSTYLAKCIQNEILMYFRTNQKTAQDVFISDPIDTDAEGNPLTFLDIIAKEDTIADEIDVKLKIEQLRKYIAQIKNSRENTVIVKRFGLDGNEPLTQKQVANILQISRSYVSRIEKKVIEDLQKKFSVNPDKNK